MESNINNINNYNNQQYTNNIEENEKSEEIEGQSNRLETNIDILMQHTLNKMNCLDDSIHQTNEFEKNENDLEREKKELESEKGLVDLMWNKEFELMQMDHEIKLKLHLEENKCNKLKIALGTTIVTIHKKIINLNTKKISFQSKTGVLEIERKELLSKIDTWQTQLIKVQNQDTRKKIQSSIISAKERILEIQEETNNKGSEIIILKQNQSKTKNKLNNLIDTWDTIIKK